VTLRTGGGTVFGDGFSAGPASGARSDLIDLRGGTAPVTVYADSQGSTTAGAGADTVFGPRVAGGTYFLDPVAAGVAKNSAADKLISGGGQDTVTADSAAPAQAQAKGGGDDIIRTGGGDDTIRADHNFENSPLGGKDRISAGAGADTIYGGAKRDICDGGLDADLDVAFRCEVRTRIP
jgi:Ca2+-binding RTX toxin-like protein